MVHHPIPFLFKDFSKLFHHGIGGSAGLWAGWLPSLIDRYRIVLWDMRGSGRSVHDGFSWSLDRLVGEGHAILSFRGAAGTREYTITSPPPASCTRTP